MARARRRKSKQSNKLTYYIIGAAVLILIIFAFPNVGKFTVAKTELGSNVEIELTTPDAEIVQAGRVGAINFTFRNLQNFDTLSFKTYIPNGSLSSNGILLNVNNMYPGGPLNNSNTNIVIGGISQSGSNRTTLNFQGINGVQISEQNITLVFSNRYGTGASGINLSEIVISDILFGDKDGNAIASFTNISRHDVVQSNLPPTVRINSPSSGSSWPDSDRVGFNITIEDQDSSSLIYNYTLDGTAYSYPAGAKAFRASLNIGNHTFEVYAEDDSGASTTRTVNFNVYNSTVPTNQTQGNQTQGNQTQGNQTNQTFNIPPVAIISSPQAGQTYNLGDSIFLNGTGSYDTDGSISSYEFGVGIHCGSGCHINTTTYTGATYNLNANNLGPGSYSVHLIVYDNGGESGRQLSLPFSITSIGDVNGDGRITGADVTAAEWLSVGVNRGYATQNADTNQDSSTNSLDITGVERILLA